MKLWVIVTMQITYNLTSQKLLTDLMGWEGNYNVFKLLSCCLHQSTVHAVLEDAGTVSQSPLWGEEFSDGSETLSLLIPMSSSLIHGCQPHSTGTSKIPYVWPMIPETNSSYHCHSAWKLKIPLTVDDKAFTLELKYVHPYHITNI
jgi:hypothetical protein